MLAKEQFSILKEGMTSIKKDQDSLAAILGNTQVRMDIGEEREKDLAPKKRGAVGT